MAVRRTNIPRHISIANLAVASDYSAASSPLVEIGLNRAASTLLALGDQEAQANEWIDTLRVR